MYVHVCILMHIHKHTHDYTKARMSALCNLYLKYSMLFLLPSLVNIIIMKTEKKYERETNSDIIISEFIFSQLSHEFLKHSLCASPSPTTVFSYCLRQQNSDPF